jgi:phosphonate transport system substrate-binding protein
LLAAPVLTGARYGGGPIYFSDVIVHRDSPARSFPDLHGRSWAYNDLDSHSGYNLTRYELISRGETRGFFSKVIEAGSHQRAMRLVAEGAVDGTAIDSQVLAIESRDHPELAEQLRVVDSFGPSTIQPVVAAHRLDAGLKRALRGVLLHLHTDPAAQEVLAHGFVARFVAVSDARYDDIREMLAAAERSGFMEIR